MNWSKLLFLIFVCSNAYSDDLFLWQGNLYKKIKKYEKIHKKFTKQVCTPGTDFKYQKLLKNYRAQGNYLPIYKGRVDRDAIRRNLALFPQKLTYIKSIEKKLKKKKRLPSFKKISRPIRESLKELLLLNKKHMLAKTTDEKDKIKIKSKKRLKKLKKEYDRFMNRIFFFKNFGYPNDHLANRFKYEKNKVKGENSKKRSNRIFFYRKMFEDGTYEKNQTRGDIYTRSTLDTIYYELRSQEDFISENLRYDLEWSLRVIERFIKRGYKAQLYRMKEWYKRTSDKYSFYKNIIKTKNKKTAQKLVDKKHKATIALKQFTYDKQAEVYLFWQKQERLMKSLFSLETILYNEVGRVDEPDGLERKDVAYIVMNRVTHPVYSKLKTNQPIIKRIKDDTNSYKDERWLNTLFRTGEFSFTYHYISSSSKIYCPDMSPVGRRLRARNLKIALKGLKVKREDFNVFRYFSRVSMFGKIDMSSVWSQYKPVPEKAGYEAKNQAKLLKEYKKDNYEYFYEFDDPRKRNFKVIRINEKVYSMTFKRGKAVFHKYRSPHLFKYFAKK